MFAVERASLSQDGYRPGLQAWDRPSYRRLVVAPLTLLFVGLLAGSLYGLAIGATLAIGFVLYESRRRVVTLTVTYGQWP